LTATFTKWFYWYRRGHSYTIYWPEINKILFLFFK
jgi:hypothetical protein